MNKKYWVFGIKIVTGVAILLLFLTQIGLRQIAEQIRLMNITYVAFGVILFLASFVLGALNVRILLDSINKKVPFLKLLRYYLVAWSYGLILPAKIGEFSILYYFRKYDISLGEGFAIAIIDKVITFGIVLIIATVFLVVWLLDARFILILLIIIAMMVAGLFFAYHFRRFISKYILRKYAAKFKGFFACMLYILKKKKKYLALNIFLTLLKWALLISFFNILFLSRGLTVNYFLTGGIIAVMNILSLVPISVDGLGIKEAVGVLLLSRTGIEYAALAGIILVHVAIKYATAFTMIALGVKIEDH